MGANKRVIKILLDLLEGEEHDAKAFKHKWEMAERKATDLFDACQDLKKRVSEQVEDNRLYKAQIEANEKAIETLKSENRYLGKEIERFRSENADLCRQIEALDQSIDPDRKED